MRGKVVEDRNTLFEGEEGGEGVREKVCKTMEGNSRPHEGRMHDLKYSEGRSQGGYKGKGRSPLATFIERREGG